eukprot:1143893-Pelagomonas_calceolata.AAC.8
MAGVLAYSPPQKNHALPVPASSQGKFMLFQPPTTAIGIACNSSKASVLASSPPHTNHVLRVPAIPQDEFMLLQPPRSAIGLARNSSIAGALASSPLEEPQGVTVGAPCLGRRSLEAEHASKNRALPKPTPHPALLKRGWKEPSCSRMKARRDSKAQAEEQQQQQQQQQPQETEQGPQPQQQQFAEEQRASEVRASLHRMGLLKQHLQQHAAAEGASLPPSSTNIRWFLNGHVCADNAHAPALHAHALGVMLHAHALAILHALEIMPALLMLHVHALGVMLHAHTHTHTHTSSRTCTRAGGLMEALHALTMHAPTLGALHALCGSCTH